MNINNLIPDERYIQSDWRSSDIRSLSDPGESDMTRDRDDLYFRPESLTETLERLQSIAKKTERLRRLERLTRNIQTLEKDSRSLLSSVSSLYYDLSYLAKDLESVSLERPEDPDLWSETADLIDTLDRMTGDLRVSLTEYLETLERKTPEIMTWINQTGDHYIEDLESPRPHYKDPETDPAGSDSEKVT